MEARRLDLVEDLHGHKVADPYRWLEDASSEETSAWSEAQDELCRSHLDGLPGRQHWARRLRELTPGSVGLPVVVGERQFFLRREPDQELDVFCVQEGDGTVRPLIDPAALNPDLTTVLDLATPSKEGDRVAYLLSHGGREESFLHVLDVATGEDVAAPVMLGRGGTVAWLPGGAELIVVRGDGTFNRRVYRHRVGGDEVLLFGEGRDKTTYYDVHTSPDGRWLLVTAALGTAPRNDAYLIDLTSGSVATVLEGADAQAYGGVAFDGRLYLLTNLDAPRNRLVVADPLSPTEWRDLLPETDDLLSDWAVTSDAVVAVRVHDVVAQVTVHDRLSGEQRETVTLPPLGTAMVTSRRDGGDDVWISYEDDLTPPTIFHYAVSSGLVSTWAAPPGAVAVDGVIARQVFFESKDGTRIPMIVLAPDGVVLDGSNPTILYGYGGFNVAITPYYAPGPVAWVEQGGVYAIANLRGGSEYGEEWHRAGMRANKQNVFDDFLAAADWLISSGYTTSERLGVAGGSNGGLLVGAALTQRPELMRAVYCSAPLLDMVRYELFGLGETWNDEYGRADVAEEFEWLLSYSPYHRVVEGTPYPAVLFTVFEGDTRVDTLHARKLCAALQHASSGRPVLLRRELEVGHGARSVARKVALDTDAYAFLSAQLGL
jgi:prolyl oligopeptidase